MALAIGCAGSSSSSTTAPSTPSVNGRTVTVRPQAADMVDGARVPIVLGDKFDSITLVSDGNEWVSLFRQP